MKISFLTVCIFALAPLCVQNAICDEKKNPLLSEPDIAKAQLIRLTDSKKIIPELQILESTLVVKTRETEGYKVPVAEVKIKVNAPGWTAWAADENMIHWLKQKLNSKNELILQTVLTGPITRFRLRITDQKGRKKLEDAVIQYGSYDVFVAKYGNPARRFTFTPSIGVAVHSYSQTDVTSFSMTALFGKIDLLYWFKPDRWSVGLNAFITIIPLTSSDTSITARFFGVTGRFGYNFDIGKGFRIGANLGWYYTTTMVSSDAFGWAHMHGPQIYPTLVYSWDKNVIGTYFKYSSIMSGLNFLTLANREMASGLFYTKVLQNGHAIKAEFDWANVSLTIATDTITSNIFAFSAGYQF